MPEHLPVFEAPPGVTYGGTSFENFMGLLEEAAATAYEQYLQASNFLPEYINVPGACAHVSLILQHRLAEVDVPTRLMSSTGQHHFFLRTLDADPLNLDATWQQSFMKEGYWYGEPPQWSRPIIPYTQPLQSVLVAHRSALPTVLSELGVPPERHAMWTRAVDTEWSWEHFAFSPEMRKLFR